MKEQLFGVKYVPKPDGVEIEEFKYKHRKYKVEETITYKPWLVGRIIPGEGQIGVYKVSSKKGEHFVLIVDYIDQYGNRQFYIVYYSNDIKDIERHLLKDTQYGNVLLPFEAVSKR
ncbi:MAG: hypothetical protein QXM68_02475 [Candidatus Aenigmatarchaeota archaeon]|nr:hypothetical protein [Candidatus Aenigmarchaeota archaeon]